MQQLSVINTISVPAGIRVPGRGFPAPIVVSPGQYHVIASNGVECCAPEVS